jgi:hypothetical protein
MNITLHEFYEMPSTSKAKLREVRESQVGCNYVGRLSHIQDLITIADYEGACLQMCALISFIQPMSNEE